MSAWVVRRTQLQRMLIWGPLLVALAWGIGALLASRDMATVRAVVILSVLIVVSLFLFRAIARSDPHGGTLFVLLVVSFGLKLLAIYFRFATRLLADALIYNRAGEALAQQLASGQWPELGRYWGTEFVRLLTGLTYVVTGNTFLGISFLWAWLALLGMLFFYRAFTSAFPQGNHRLYMFLIFLFPSMLLWTSSLGKDALMVFFLGMGAYGVARMQRRIELIGAWWLALGVAGMLLVRPHLTAVFSVALAASFLVRPIRAGMLTPVFRLAGLLLFALLAFAVVRTASGFVGIERLSPENVLAFIDVQQERTAQGGSAFTQGEPGSLRTFLLAIPTILFRPFPWEANNTFAVVASLEGAGLLLLMLYRWRSVAQGVWAAVRQSYPLLILVYVVLFIFFFSAIQNFGIIARQRVQLFPFVFMWIAYLAHRPGPARQR